MSAHGHAHDHAHDHAHGVGHARGANRRRLAIVLALSAAYMVAEVVGGAVANSLALLADAGHMLSDVAALALALVALRVAGRPATARRTYGFHRAEILAALANGAALLAIAAFVVVEAWQRLRDPPAVNGGLMIGVATGGLLVNLVGLRVLHDGRRDSLNVRGAWLHVLADAMGSVGAILAGVLLLAFGWAWADPAASVVIALLVVASSWSLLRESVGVLMEGAPGGVDVDAVRDAMLGVEGVAAVHDLHVWSITSGMAALSAHVRAADGASGDALLRALGAVLRERFGIAHTTIQIEREVLEDCAPCE